MVQTLKWATAHLSIRLGARRRGAGRARRGAGSWRSRGTTRGARGTWACGAATRPLRAPGRACAPLGVLLGQQAVHLVHPACFWTQYCL